MGRVKIHDDGTDKVRQAVSGEVISFLKLYSRSLRRPISYLVQRMVDDFLKGQVSVKVPGPLPYISLGLPREQVQALEEVAAKYNTTFAEVLRAIMSKIPETKEEFYQRADGSRVFRFSYRRFRACFDARKKDREISTDGMSFPYYKLKSIPEYWEGEEFMDSISEEEEEITEGNAIEVALQAQEELFSNLGEEGELSGEELERRHRKVMAAEEKIGKVLQSLRKTNQEIKDKMDKKILKEGKLPLPMYALRSHVGSGESDENEG